MTLSWGIGGTQGEGTLLKLLQKDVLCAFQRVRDGAPDLAETRIVPVPEVLSDPAGSSAREARVAHVGPRPDDRPLRRTA